MANRHQLSSILAAKPIWKQPMSSRHGRCPTPLKNVAQAFFTRPRHEETKLRTIALDRLLIWECLCSMVEDVPKALIFRLQLIDAMHRGHTQPSNALVDDSYVGELAHDPDPRRQFWYMYRAHFYDISSHWNDVCWLENRARIAELYYYDQRVAANIALREASEKTVYTAA
jgi:hypothetical protein